MLIKLSKCFSKKISALDMHSEYSSTHSTFGSIALTGLQCKHLHKVNRSLPQMCSKRCLAHACRCSLSTVFFSTFPAPQKELQKLLFKLDLWVILPSTGRLDAEKKKKISRPDQNNPFHYQQTSNVYQSTAKRGGTLVPQWTPWKWL